MSRINDFSFSFKEPSKAHRVTVCMCVREKKVFLRVQGEKPRWCACFCLELALENACKAQTFAMAGWCFCYSWHYNILCFFWLLPLSFHQSGKSNVVQRGHVRWNNGSKILNKEWKGAGVWMTIGQKWGWELMMWGGRRSRLMIDLHWLNIIRLLFYVSTPLLSWYHTENGKMWPANDLPFGAIHFLY